MPARVVQFSGGIASWCVAQRVAARHGTDDLVLLFANTQIEDDDLYAFVHASAAQLAVPLVVVADGRTPWEVFEDKQIIGNSRLAPCSFVLKILPCRRWLTDNTDPADTVLYIGIDNSTRDQRRAPAIRHGWQPWHVELPLLDEPELTKQDMLAEARALGLTPPAAYSLGWEHANFTWTGNSTTQRARASRTSAPSATRSNAAFAACSPNSSPPPEPGSTSLFRKVLAEFFDSLLLAALVIRRCRVAATGERRRDSRRTVRADPRVRPGQRRPLQPRRHGGGRGVRGCPGAPPPTFPPKSWDASPARCWPT